MWFFQMCSDRSPKLPERPVLTSSKALSGIRWLSCTVQSMWIVVKLGIPRALENSQDAAAGEVFSSCCHLPVTIV